MGSAGQLLVPAPLRGRPRTPRDASQRRSGFNFTHHIRLICQDMVTRLPQLQHIDLRKVAISFCQTRKAVPHGLQAALTPMRFQDGKRWTVRRGKRLGVQQLLDADGNEMLYILSFYLPRFLDQPFEEKLVTILHELWHISPQFDGDLRRHPGRCYAHSHDERQYDAAMAQMARQWLDQGPPAELLSFLNESFRSLHRRHDGIYGTKVPAPKLVPLD